MIKLIMALILTSSVSQAAQVFFGSPSYVTVDGTSTQVIPQNNLRNYLIIVNMGSNEMFVNFGAPGSGSGIPIPAGGNYEPFQPPMNSVYLVSPSGTTAAVMQGQ